MANVSIEYKNQSFEENPLIITWVQLFFIELLSNMQKEDWINELIVELKSNSQIEIYKYVFDEETLDSLEKKKWAISFLNMAEKKINEMSLDDFEKLISQEITSKANFDRVKEAIQKLLNLYH